MGFEFGICYRKMNVRGRMFGMLYFYEFVIDFFKICIFINFGMGNWFVKVVFLVYMKILKKRLLILCEIG